MHRILLRLVLEASGVVVSLPVLMLQLCVVGSDHLARVLFFGADKTVNRSLESSLGSAVLCPGDTSPLVTVIFVIIVVFSEHGPCRLVLGLAILVEPLCRHSEVLHFQVLDSIAQCSIHLPQMDQFVVNLVNCQWTFFAGVFIWTIFVFLRCGSISGEPAVFSVAFLDIGLDRRAQHVIKLGAIVFQNVLHQLHSLSQLLVFNVQLRVLGIFGFKVPLDVLYTLSELSVSLQ